MKTYLLPLLVVLALVSPSFAQDATTQPSEAGSEQPLIRSTDANALTANIGKQVTVEGKIESAAWSKSGAVMNVTFADSPLVAAAFKKNREKLDESYSGDLAKTLSGATVRLKGKLETYGGKMDALKGHPQIIISMGSQITIVQAAVGTATTQEAQ